MTLLAGSVLAVALVIGGATGTQDPRPRPVTATSREITVVGVGGVPSSGVAAVVVNVTGVGSARPTFVTVWPAGAPKPATSNLNIEAGTATPNLAIIPVGRDGKVAVAVGRDYADIVFDVLGWFDTGPTFEPIGPSRLLDTRATKQRLTAGTTIDLSVGSAAGTVLNVTAVDPAGPGFVTVWPSGTDRPGASNLNLTAGRTRPNLVIVRPGVGGKVRLFASGDTDLVVDQVANLGAGFTGIAPRRALDTRVAARRVPGGQTIQVPTGLDEGDAAAINVTAVDPAAPGFVTAWPTGEPRPFTSTLNTEARLTAPNSSIVRVGQGGQISLFTTADTDFVVDLFGSFAPGKGFHGLAPARIHDSRPPTTPVERRVFPVVALPGNEIAYQPDHGGYPATDIFSACGTPIVSPVDGIVSEVRRIDQYRPSNPDTWGGRSVAIIGDDGVRYYGSHYDAIEISIEAGVRVAAGQRIGTMGRTGDTSVCHLHFGLSPACPVNEWWVRRGVIWPWPYLDAWRAGINKSPAVEVDAWLTSHPSGCVDPP